MATQNRTVAIGIDLGTSKCCVAAVRDGRVHVLENEFGQRTTSSWVAFNSQQRLVGGAALDQAVVNCANTVSAVKRTLGRTYDDVKHFSSPCKIIKNYDSFQYYVSYKKRDKYLAPEQITSMMLTKMKDIAETSLGCEVNRAVISVPASYGNAQRVALKTAAKVAGIEVLQLINETTAAGIAFEHSRNVKTPLTIAVVDFGAGKLDVSVMEVKEKSLRVMAASGSPYFGGCDVDEILVDHCVKFIQQKFGTEVKINDKGRVKLRLACEKAKKTLSLLPVAKVRIESLFEDCDVQIPLHRQDISEVIDDTIRSTITGNFERIFEENSIAKDVIEKVVLVGGSRHIPTVKTILEEYFGSHKLDQTVNQDEAVAQGAALRAAALSGAAAGIQVADVSSFDIYSISQIMEGGESTVIRSNTSIPFSANLPFSVSYWDSTVSFFERNYSPSCKMNYLLGTLSFSRGFSRIIFISFSLDVSGIFNIVDSQHRSSFDKRRMSSYYHDILIRDWISAEKQFRQDIRDELARAETEVTLESLIFEIQSAIQDPEIVKYCPSNLKFLQIKCSTAQSCVNDISSYSEYKIKAQIKTMREAKTEVERWKVAAHKKAAEEKNAKERAELEQAVTQKNSELRLLHSELQKSLKQPELVQYSPPEEIKVCEEVLGRIDTSQKYASFKEVSEKIELLNGVKSRIEKLEESSQKKAREEEELARVKKQHLEEEISSALSLVKSLRGKLLSSELGKVEYSQLTDNFQQKIKSFKESLYYVLGWVTNADTTSLSEISKKIKEVNEIIADVVELEDTLLSAQIRKTELSESSTEKSKNVLEMPFSENDGQINYINNSDERVLHSESGEMQAKSTNSSAGHTPRSREKPRRNSPSRSRSTEGKEKVDCDRSRSPLPKGIETGHHTPPFGSLSDTELDQVSTVLSQGTRTRVELEKADGGCQPSQESSSDISKLNSSCRKEKEHLPPASRVSSNAEDKNIAAVGGSSASASAPNGANYCLKNCGASVQVSSQSSTVSLPGIENCVDSDSHNTTTVGLQRSSLEKVSSIRNDVVSNSTQTTLGSPSGASERESETTPAQFEREASESSNGPNDLQENVAKTSNLFYQHPDIQSMIKREIDTCKICRRFRRVCYETRISLVEFLNEMIDDTGTQIFKSAASGCNGKTPQQVMLKAQVSEPEALEQVKKLPNRDTESTISPG